MLYISVGDYLLVVYMLICCSIAGISALHTTERACRVFACNKHAGTKVSGTNPHQPELTHIPILKNLYYQPVRSRSLFVQYATTIRSRAVRASKVRPPHHPHCMRIHTRHTSSTIRIKRRTEPMPISHPHTSSITNTIPPTTRTAAPAI